MDSCQIGNVTFLPDGPLLRLAIDDQRDQTTWTVAGVEAVMAYLRAWRETQAPPLPSHDCPWCGEACACADDRSCEHACGAP